MLWYHWLSIITALICLVSLGFHTIRLIRNGDPADFSQKRGTMGKSISYSFTGAMSPVKKESAFLYLPTYTAGILYHIGTFLSVFLFILFVAGFSPLGMTGMIISVLLLITGLSGAGILIKRMSKKQLRYLSNPDDYISNLLVTIFQLMTAAVLQFPGLEMYYFISISLLFLYLPLGKLKHTVYFFAARYHLGFFYGWRGVWPPKQG